MAAYSFKAIDKQGQKHKGVMDGDSPRRIRQQLRTQGWVPLTIQKTSESTGGGFKLNKRAIFSSSALTRFTRELSILLEGGLQLETAVHLLAMQASSLRMRDCLLNIRSQITEGVSFSSSMANHPDEFPALYRATIAAGEHVGDVAGVLKKLADYGETHLRMLSKVKLAMLYPLILAAFATLVVIGMLVFVFPDITKTFLQSGQELPTLTMALMLLSDLIRKLGLFLLLGLCVAFFAVRQALRIPENQLKLHRLLLQVPLLQRLIMAINLSRFTATLSMLRASGLPMTEALRISSEVLTNRWLRKVMQQVNERVIEGVSLSQALTQSGYFPLSYIHMIASGEASGELDRMLELTAHNQMKDLEKQMMFGVAFLEPVIILVMGLMVLLIVLAIMMPILSMNQLVK